MAKRKREPSAIYLVRHAPAEDEHPLGDGGRALTAAARAEFRDHAAIVAGKMNVVGVATSPLVRAVQTAELLAEALGVTEVRVFGQLKTPGGSAQSIGALSRELGLGWALVGHNPSLAETLAQLLGASSEVRLRKGAVAALVPGPEGRTPWSLAWLHEPGRKAKHRL